MEINWVLSALNPSIINPFYLNVSREIFCKLVRAMDYTKTDFDTPTARNGNKYTNA
jgi:hypothetical protein